MRPARSAMNSRPSGANARSTGEAMPSATVLARPVEALRNVDRFAADEVCPVIVTRSGTERALSSTPPSLTKDASSSECAPGNIEGRRAVHGKRDAAAMEAQVTPVSSVRAPST